LIHYEAIASPVHVGDLSALCPADHGSVLIGTQPVGAWYHVVGRNRDGVVVSDELVCVPLVALGSPDPPPPPPLPKAPTVEEVWKSVQIPAPEIHADPPNRGVTGLTTDVWSGGPAEVPVSVQVRGFTVTGVAHLDGYRVGTDEGMGTTVVAAGAANAPAMQHRFETKGEHAIAVSSVWHAVVSLTGPGITAPVTIDAGSATLTARLDYPVVEVRSVLLP
jgi:hypothetical protein